jgi:hypothetical protein
VHEHASAASAASCFVTNWRPSVFADEDVQVLKKRMLEHPSSVEAFLAEVGMFCFATTSSTFWASNQGKQGRRMKKK